MPRTVLRVTPSQVEAAKLLIELAESDGREPDPKLQHIASALPARNRADNWLADPAAILEQVRAEGVARNTELAEETQSFAASSKQEAAGERMTSSSDNRRSDSAVDEHTDDELWQLVAALERSARRLTTQPLRLSPGRHLRR